ncbi:hypothetical protein FIBSPDRAFT_884655 [Athelia psychrophila]|uniref:Uncharacterized protein n=1 Tax=Athelia psychrophila TaxID=1759441 RepID=A0A166SZD5_9AGAM|nr:hypothetical protein FIBSPDRAFT_884655 [Fibularhizoctonia sp. CBS 109695]
MYSICISTHGSQQPWSLCPHGYQDILDSPVLRPLHQCGYQDFEYLPDPRAGDAVYQDDDDPLGNTVFPRIPDVLGNDQAIANTLSRESTQWADGPTSAVSVPQHLMQSITPQLLNRWNKNSIAGTKKDDMVKEAGTQANTAATREAKEVTAADDHFRGDICHAGLQWRTELKQAICDHLREWGLCPSLTEIELKKLTTVNIRSHIVMHSILTKYHYRELQLSVTMPTGFLPVFPAAALVLVQTLATGIYTSQDLDQSDIKEYERGLTTMTMYLKLNTAYGQQKKNIRQAQHDIVERGKAQHPSAFHALPALSDSELGQYHPHILPIPLVPGKVDSDLVNDGEGDDDAAGIQAP